MSRELKATLISAAMIAAVFIVASQLDGYRRPASVTVEVFGVELARDASRAAVAEQTRDLNLNLRAAVLQNLGISEAELAAARDQIIDDQVLDKTIAEDDMRQLLRVAAYLDAAVAQMPETAVVSEEARSEFIAALKLPADVDVAAFHTLLSATPENRAALAAELRRMAGSTVDDLNAEMRRALRAALLPQAEVQALRQMICDRAEALELSVPALVRDSERLGVSARCSLLATQYVERLVEEALPDARELRARVLSVLTLAQGI